MSLKKNNDTSVAILIAVGVFAVFSLAPTGGFLRWDDTANLVDNDKWRGLSWAHLKWMWSTRHYGPWQPLSWFSWAIDFKIWGLNPDAFRRTNVTFHAITAGIFFLVCRRLLPRESPNSLPLGAAGAALFFALHPLRVESVIWITERRDVLSGLFAVLSIYLWLENRRRLSAFTFAAAVMSKGTALAVLPFIFMIEVFLRREPARKTVASLLPHAVIGLFAACRNLGGFLTGDLHGLNLAFGDRVLVALAGAWFYVLKTLLPFNLSPYYGLVLNGDGVRLESYPGALWALALTVLCFHKSIRAWALPIWFSFLIALAPVSGLLQNGRQAAADRYSYLACLPFSFLFGLALTRIRGRSAAAVILVASLFLAVATVRQSEYWRDDISLWTRAVEIQPDAYLPNSNLGVALLVAGKPDASIPYFEKAMVLEPRDAQARVNLASIAASNGDAPRAIELFSEAVELRPADPLFASARFNLGVLLIRAGRKSDGLAQVREAVRLDPSLKRAASSRGP